MNAILITYYEFRARCSEWLDERVILAYESELLSMYCAGATVYQAAQAITEIDRRPDL